MSDVALSAISVPKKTRYNPDKDAPRMKIYMQNLRDKNRVGYTGTVNEWLNAGKPEGAK